jgi:RimJ/RimL family protein N-acetyltransferase
MTYPTISLRPVIPDDLPIFYEHQLDQVATQMADFPSREREAFMAHWAKITQDENVLIRTVLEDGQVVGSLVSFVMQGQREVGYWFGRECWGRGLATRAFAAFLLVETRRPLHAYTAKHNIGSQRVLEKCSFKQVSEQEQWLVFVLL